MSARHPDRDVGIQLSMALVALASLIVPSSHRPDWRREWEAEVWHRWDRIKRWAAVNGRTRLRLWRTCTGAFADAFCMRSHAAAESIVFDDVRRGVGMLVERPRATIGAGLMLTLGLGVASALLALTIPALSRAPLVSEPDRLVIVRNTCSAVANNLLPASVPEYDTYRAQSQVFSDAASIYVRRGVVTHDGAAGPARIASVSPNFFDVLGAFPLVGDVNGTGGDSSPPTRTAVLGYQFWQTRFEGDPTVIGQRISVEHEQLTIVAVMPREFDCPATADLWWPRNPGEAPQAAGGPDARFLNVVGRLKPGVSLDTAQHQLSDLVGRIKPAVGGSSPGPQWGVSVVSVERNLTSREFAPLVALLGLAIVLIAIASLGAARRLLDSEARLPDTLSSVLRRRIVRGLVLAIGGACCGLVVAAVAMPWLRWFQARLAPDAAVGLDGRVAMLVLGIAITSGIVVGVVSTMSRTATTHRVLAGARAALVVVLAGGSLVLVVSVARSRSVPSGLDPSGQVTYRLALDARDDGLVSAYDTSLANARSMRGVVDAAAVDILPLEGGSSDRSMAVERGPERITVDHECRSVSPRYFEVVGIPVLAGRAFRDSDRPGAPDVAIVNAAFAQRYWPDDGAIGRRILFPTSRGLRSRTVVGVVGNVGVNRLDDEPAPEVYCPFPQLPTRAMSVVATTADGTWPAIRTDVALIEGGQLSTDVRTLRDLADQAVAPQIAFAVLAAICAIVSLVLVAPEVFGSNAESRE